MIYRLIDLPSNVIGFKALWYITEKDFEEVLIPSVQDHFGKTGKLNCLIILSNSMKYFWISALKGIKMLMNWKAKWCRVAIVSESKTARFFINLFSKIFTSKFKGFSTTELEEAIAWASEDTKR